MQNGGFNNIFWRAGIFLFLVFFIDLSSIQAATLELAGKAYWGNYGYIYFHCNETHTGNLLDEASNLSGAGKYLNPSLSAFHFTGAPCSLVYGVEIDQNSGVLTGKAWNNSLGLISFQHDGIDPPNYDFAVNCNGGATTCSASNNCIACYNFSDSKVYGWGQIDFGTGKDWINLNAHTLPIYLEVDLDNPGWPAQLLALGDFGGIANIEDIDGNSPPYPATISFNCLTMNYNIPNPFCTDHRVYIKNLILTNLSAPNWSQSSACSSGALKAILKWNRFGGAQLGYEILVSEESDFNIAQTNYLIKEEVNSPATQHILDDNHLEYDKTYYWWIRGKDSENNWTEWVQYDNNKASDTDLNRDANTKTFQTFKHEMPIPIFIYTGPIPILTNTTTTFTSTSTYYTASNPKGPTILCDETNCDYSWSTNNPLDSIVETYTNPTEIIFNENGNQAVMLQVTDNSGYSCVRSENFNVNYDLPLWREVKAQ